MGVNEIALLNCIDHTIKQQRRQEKKKTCRTDTRTFQKWGHIQKVGTHKDTLKLVLLPFIQTFFSLFKWVSLINAQLSGKEHGNK